jgi:hypothetical protein
MTQRSPPVSPAARGLSCAGRSALGVGGRAVNDSVAYAFQTIGALIREQHQKKQRKKSQG